MKGIQRQEGRILKERSETLRHQGERISVITGDIPGNLRAISQRHEICESDANFVTIPDRCSHLFEIIILVWLCSQHLELLWKTLHLSIDLVVVA